MVSIPKVYLKQILHLEAKCLKVLLQWRNNYRVLNGGITQWSELKLEVEVANIHKGNQHIILNWQFNILASVLTAASEFLTQMPSRSIIKTGKEGWSVFYSLIFNLFPRYKCHLMSLSFANNMNRMFQNTLAFLITGFNKPIKAIIIV